MTRRKFIIIIVILILVGAGVVAWAALRPRETPPEANEPTYAATISNLDTTSTNLPQKRIDMIKNYVSAMVVAKYGDGKYDAVYRDGSYKRTVTPQGGIVSTALIDVTTTKETYLVTWTGGENDTHGTSYARCAPEADQLVQPSVCKELSND